MVIAARTCEWKRRRAQVPIACDITGVRNSDVPYKKDVERFIR